MSQSADMGALPRTTATIRGILRQHAAAQPDESAYTFISSRDTAWQTWTWRELDHRARAIGSVLQDAGQAGRPVMLLRPAGLEYVASFLGCLYAGAIAVPAYPPDGRNPGRMLPRLSAIAADSRAAVALTTEDTAHFASAERDQLATAGLGSLSWIATERIPGSAAADWRETPAAAGTLAMLQYTSGSTASPKGVMVSNENLISNLAAIHRHLRHDAGSAVVSWLPPFHDMGLIGGILEPLYGGFPAYLMAPETFALRPLLWLEVLSRTAAPTSVAPNFGFEHCLRHVTPEQRDALDLSHWKQALVGAEPIRPDTLTRFAAYFAPSGFDSHAFLSCYGLAEATLMVTGTEAGTRPAILPCDTAALSTGQSVPVPPGTARATRLIGCGYPVEGTEIQIVEESTGRTVPDGQVGEIWISGSGVARGYWRRPKESEETFRAVITDRPGTGWLRTGDLGFRRDGSLHVVGRLKDIVIVQGRNFYPQDIEQTAECASAGVRSGQVAAFGIEVDGAEQLIVACGVNHRERPDADAVLAAVRAAVAREHDIVPHAVLLVKGSSLSRTTSGKLQRHSCRDLFLRLRLPVIAASVLHDDEPARRPGPSAAGASERLNRDLLDSELLLGADGPASADRRLADAGIDYPRLRAAVRELERRVGARLDLGGLLVTPTAGALASLIDGHSLACGPVQAAGTGHRANGAAAPAAPASSAVSGQAARDIEGWLVAAIAERLGLPLAAIDVTAPLAEIGLGSRQSVALLEDLGRWLDRAIVPDEVFDCPSIRAVAADLGSAAEAHPAAQAAAEPAQREIRSAPVPGDHCVPIAIVGIGARFPGAPDVSGFWRLLIDERDATSSVPPSRWDATRTDAPAVGGFIDHVDEFDARFFGISAREAERIDPQQRLLLEVAWQALDDAGIAADRLVGTDTGVFVGISSSDYATLTMTEAHADMHAATGSAHAIAANRISYLLDLRGPSMALDTACSSSLVAVHQAYRSIRTGECRVALAGGVNLMLSVPLSVAFSRAGMLARDGRCRVFDDAADGYVRGEGAGMVCLKPLPDAVADGDQIYAVIRGSAIGHGGRSNGITAPRGTAQREVIERALAQAGIRPGQVDYVEAHGTGTPLGDPVEWDALAQVYGSAPRENPCLVGSVKATIGHLEAAAGIAGLIKTALVLRHRVVTRQLQLETLSRRLSDSPGLSVPYQAEKLSADGERRAAVSSFGFGGANAHLVLQSAPERPTPARSEARELAWHALCISAHSPGALAGLASRYRAHLAAHPDLALADLCHSANTGRSHLSHRAVVITADARDLDGVLESVVRDEPGPGVLTGHVSGRAPGPVAFLFSGQGAQYPGMGRDFYETFPQFARTIDECDEILHPQLGQPLTDLLFGDASGRLKSTEICQPALVAFEIALARLWMACGIRPAAVLGHSVGAYAAANVAGVMSLGDALALVSVRGRSMSQQPGDGAMIACSGNAEAVRALADHTPALAIAAENAPGHLVLSGPLRDIDAAADAVRELGVTVRRLEVSHAFHHPRLMSGAAEPLREAARPVTFAPPAISWVSDATGDFVTVADADYWVRHLLGCVRFGDSMDTLLRHGFGAFVEIGPHPTLLSLGRAIASHHGQDSARWLPSLRRDAEPQETFLRSLATAHCEGMPVDWSALDQGHSRVRVPLPQTVFERQSYWLGGVQQPTVMNARNHSTLVTNIGTRPGTDPSATDTKQEAGDSGDFREPDTSARREIAGTVLHAVARVSGFPVHRITPQLRLGLDLGFDSLMRTELHRALSGRFPEMAAGLRDEFPDDPSVAQIIAFLGGAEAGEGTQDAGDPHNPGDNGTGRSAEPERVFEDWPEYQALAERMRTAEATGTNPYGRVHDGFNSGHAVVSGRPVINFTAFNYLALSCHPRVHAAAKAAIDQYGTSSSATPLLCGETPLHHELDAEIARFLGTEGAIVFAGGHATNVATVSHLFGPDDLILHDEWIHDSSVRGAVLSGARRRPFPHNDWQALDEILTSIRGGYRRVLILIEGAYSQDGDLPDLPRFIAVKKRHSVMLMIDEAHSIGVLGRTGRGAGEHFDIDRADVDLWMGTLSKALGSLGGYIAARRPVIEYLKFTTPLYIFSTGISPANAAAALEALRVLGEEPQRVSRLQALAEHFRDEARARGFDIGVSRASAVIPVILGDWETSMRVSNALLSRGVNVMPIGYPAVPANKCRLRFFVNLDHTEADLDHALDLLEKAMADSANRERAVSTAHHQRPSGADPAAEVLVTGASGFIGGHLARRLAQAGLRIRVLARKDSDLSAISDVPVEVVRGDLGDTAALRQATAGVRYVYNCAGKSADWGPWAEFRTANIDGPRNLVEAAVGAGTVTRLVHLSTTDVYGYPVRPCGEDGPLTDTGLPYNRSKLLGEQAVREAGTRLGLPVTVIRPVSVYGPGSKDFVIEIATMLLRKQMVYISGGGVPAGLIYVGNLVDGLVAACESETAAGQAYNLRDGDLTTWREYVTALAHALGAPPPSLNLPGPVAMGIARASETIWGALRIKSRPVLTRHAVRLFDRDQSYPVDRARADFQFKSRITFAEGIRLTTEWLRSPAATAAIPALAGTGSR